MTGALAPETKAVTVVETDQMTSDPEAVPTTDDAADSEVTPGGPPTGRVASLSARAGSVREAAKDSFEAVRGRSRVVDALGTIVLRPRLVADTILAGYLALRLFVLLFPLAYMLVAGLGIYSHDASGDPAEVANDVGLAPAVTASISEAARTSSRGHWLALIIGLVATLWAARAVLRALRGGHALVWGVPVPKTKASPVGPLLVAAGVVALALMASVLERLRTEGVPWWAVSLVAVVLEGGLWLAVSNALPHAAGRWYDLVPGAVVFSLGLQSLNIATSLYFGPKVANASAAYGVLGVGLVLISALVMFGWIVLLSAEVNAGLHHWRTGRSGATGVVQAPPANPIGESR
jgi:uncharacterized BrkB/YihY/UPF0761 family membrane protein